MGRRMGWKAKILSGLLTAILVLSAVPGDAAAEDGGASGQSVSDPQTASPASYAVYQEAYAGQIGSGRIEIAAAQGFETSDEVRVEQDYLGEEGDSLYTPEGSTVAWTFTAESAGLYTLKVRYCPVEGKGVDIQRAVLINGDQPFEEAGNLLFPRIWVNAVETFEQDIYGNDIRPSQIEAPAWIEKTVYDSDGYYSEPLAFYLEAGENTITLKAVNEPMMLGALTFEAAQPLCSYAQVKEAYEREGYTEVTDQLLTIQGEAAAFKSSATLYPTTDRTSPATEPYEESVIRLNTIGGSRWAYTGQYIVWNFSVPASGLYRMAIKVRQNTLTGVVSGRRIYIDGAVPFSEMNAVSFRYSANWQSVVLGGEEDPFLFYLEAGDHQLMIEVTPGKMGEVLQEAEDILLEINTIYREILVVTGSSPDYNRDYRLDTLIPETLENMLRQYERLMAVIGTLQAFTGEESNDNIGTLKTVARQLKSMAENPNKIARNFSYFKTNIGSMGTWLNQNRQQPLEIDYITIYSGDRQPSNPNAGFWELLRFHIRNFIDSFIKDYDSVGNRMADNSVPGVTVWISTGRDQMQTLKSIINDTFVPTYGIPVDLKLVTQGTLLSATIAGIGPDVALGVAMTDPVNYALRGAVQDLRQFEGFNEVYGWFNPELFVPYRLNGGYYALPETQGFPVMFYRTDILSELGVSIPETWEDVIALISVLSKQSMEFGLSNTIDVNTFYMLLMQSGGQVYTEDETATALDSNASVAAFKKWANFYVNYKVSREVDLLNRFRVGEIPIGISDFSLYNSLQVSAPEIKGLWSFTTVPGTRQEDGSIDCSTVLTSTASVLMSGSENPEGAWTFLRWWVSADAQTRFGTEMESVLGESARYPTANMEAFSRLPWSKTELAALQAQQATAKGIAQVPGSYYLSRHLTNAIRRVVLHDADAKDTLLDYVYVINKEIANKRKEFHMS